MKHQLSFSTDQAPPRTFMVWRLFELADLQTVGFEEGGPALRDTLFSTSVRQQPVVSNLVLKRCQALWF